MGLWQKLSHWLLPEPPLEASLVQAVDHTVEVVDPALRMLGGLQHVLAPAVRRAMGHCADLVAQLPPPVTVSHAAFAADPLVHAMFASADDIDAMLGRSAAMHDFLADSGNAFSDECYGLLGLRCREKTVVGMGQQGAVLQADVPQHYVYFTDHTLQQLSLSEADTRRCLQVTAFDSLLRQYAEVLAGQRQAREELRVAWAAERVSGRGELTPDEKAWRISSLQDKYNQSTAALAPERVLESLVAWLMSAQEHFYLEPCTVTVDCMGRVVDANEEQGDVHTLHWPQLVSRDRRRWIVTLVRVSCAEARAAVDEQTRLQAQMRAMWI